MGAKKIEIHSLQEPAKKKKALIVCNGEAPNEKQLQIESRDADLVFCCDGAAEYVWAKGIKVDFLVGDFDSLGEDRSIELAKQFCCERLQWPEHKDKTDSQLAAELAMEMGCNDLIFLGALGKRFDHTLANALLLVHCRQHGADAAVKDDKNVIRACCTHLFVNGQVGDYLSIVPLGINVQIRTTLGLEYPIYDRDLRLGDSYSISNRFSEKQAYIEVAHGWVLIIQSWDESLFL